MPLFKAVDLKQDPCLHSFALFEYFSNFWATLNECSSHLECLPIKLLANFLDFIFVLQNEHLILIAKHDFQGFPAKVKTRDFGILIRFARFCDFWTNLNKCCAHLECLVFKLVSILVNLILVLQYRLLALAFFAMFVSNIAKFKL